jgi:hypothetical protein
LGSEALRKEPLTLNFKEDTLTTVSRPMLRVMASKLGFNETQTGPRRCSTPLRDCGTR